MLLALAAAAAIAVVPVGATAGAAAPDAFGGARIVRAGDSFTGVSFPSDLVALRPDGALSGCTVAGSVEVRGGRLTISRCRIGGRLLAAEGAEVVVESSAISGGVLVGPLSDVRLSGTEATVRRVRTPPAVAAAPPPAGTAEVPAPAASAGPPPPASPAAPRGPDPIAEAEAALALVALDRAALALPADRAPADAPRVVRAALADPVGALALVEAPGAWALGEADASGLLRAAADAFDSPPTGTPLTAAEREELAAGLAELVRGDPVEPTLLEAHLLGPEERARSARLGDLARRVPTADLVRRAEDVLRAIVEGREPSGFGGFGGFGVEIVRGGPGDDTHVCRPAREGEILVLVDPGGNDRYVGAPAAAAGGVALLVDSAGDDVYAGGDRSVGAALTGVAVLLDRSGNDRYAGGRGAIGVGLAGVGILLDEGGDDAYSIGAFGEGAAGPGGVGLLVDHKGDDLYEAGGGADLLRDPSYANSMAQGFAAGHRPGAAGGVGVLVDGGGRDLYRAENFAQGVGYWGGAGVLVDEGGDDRYLAHRYVQGAGVHLALGLLVDGGGRDLYDGWTMAQGAGHDLAVGLLADAGGNDLYRAHSLAQGGGSANGAGVLIDRGGDDRYAVEADHGQGVGDFENEVRRRGSAGLLLDLDGDDAYSRAAAGDGRTWTSGARGIGRDLPAAAAPPAAAVAATPTGWYPSAAETEGFEAPAEPAVWRECFLLLASGRAEHRGAENAARGLLARDAPASLVWAAGWFDPWDPREWRAIRDAAGAAGPRVAEALADVAAARRAAGDTQAAALILHALGATRNASARRRAEPYLDDPLPALRAAGAKVLGDLLEPLGGDAPGAEVSAAPTLRRLARALADPETPVRRLAADALGRIARPQAALSLVGALGDADAWTAIAAAGALASIAQGEGLPADALHALAEAARTGAPRARRLAERLLLLGAGAGSSAPSP